MTDVFSWLNTAASGSTTLLLLDMFIKATLLLVVAFLASALLRRSSAAVRHCIWCLTFAGLLLLPILSSLLPGWCLPILPGMFQADETPTVTRIADNTFSETDYVAFQASEIRMKEPTLDESLGDFNPVSLQAESSVNSERFQQAAAPPVPHVKTNPTRETTSAVPWLAMLGLLWLVGVGAFVLPLVLSPLYTRRLTRSAREINDPQPSGLLWQLCHGLGIRRSVRLLETDKSLIPMTWGVLRPVLLLPGTWRNWSKQRQQFVLLHELAHVKRYDVAFQMLGRGACALYWLHPLAWYALRRMRIERELACDDCVLMAGQRPSDYAQQLVDIARTHHLPGVPTAVAMLQSKNLEGRVRAVLDKARSRLPLSRNVGRLFLVSAALLVTLLAVVQPEAWSEPQVETLSDAAEATPSTQDADEAASESEESSMDRQALLALAQRNRFQDGKVVTLEPIHGTITGRRGRPVAGAKVYLREHPRSWKSWGRNTPTETRDLAVTVSDDKGRFRFENIKSKPLHILRKDVLPVDVIVLAEGYAAAWRRLSKYGTADFQLKPGSRIHGRIVDEKQEPAKGTTIRVLRFLPLTEIANMDLSRHVYPLVGKTLDLAHAGFQIAATVDEQGEFVLSGLPKNSGIMLEVSDLQHYREIIYTTANPDHPVWRESAHVSMPASSSYTVPSPYARARVADEETKRRARFGLRESVQISPIKIALHRGIRLQVRVVDDETGGPIPGSRLPQAPIFTYPGRGVTDENGVYGYSQLEPGNLSLRVAPPEGSKWIGVRTEVELAKEAYEAEAEVRLSRGAIVSGKVVDQTTGRGIADVRLHHIVLAGRTSASAAAKTDQEGQFHIVGPPGKGQVILYSTVPGYETPVRSGSIHQAPERFKRSVNATLDTPQTDIVFELVPDVLFHGRTLDLQGKPVGGVKITGKIARGVNSYMPLEQHSDGQGRYALTGFYADVLQKRRPKITILFQDESRGLATRVTFSPPTDETKQIERDIHLQPAGTVTGRVINDQTNEPVVGASVGVSLLTGNSDRHLGSTKTDQQGRYTYRLLVPDAEHMVNIRAKGYVASGGRSAYSKRITVKAGETRTMPEFHMTPKAVAESTADIPKVEPPKIDGLSPEKALESLPSRYNKDRKAYRAQAEGSSTGEAQDSTNLPVRITAAPTEKPLEGVRIQFHGRIGGGTLNQVLETDKDGFAELKRKAKAPVEHLWMTAQKPGFIPVHYYWGGDARPVELPARLDFKLASGFRIEGTVEGESGRPIAGASVDLTMPITWPRLASHVFTAAELTTDAEGRWMWDGAPEDPAIVSIRVTHSDYRRAMISAARGEANNVTLKQGLQVTGRVIDLEGKPISGATARLGFNRFGTNEPTGKTNANGRFVLKNCKAGKSLVTVQAEGYAPQFQKLVVRQHHEGLEFRLEAGQTLRVRVVDSQGKPVQGAIFATDTWRGYRTIELWRKTDAEGRVVWNAAPPDSVLCDVLKSGYMSVRKIPLTASDEEQVITLPSKLEISGRVTDAETGKPITSFEVREGKIFTNSDRTYWSGDEGVAYTDGKYSYTFDEPVEGRVLRVVAHGYRPETSRAFRSTEGKVDYDFKLSPGKGPSGVVVKADGTPAQDVEVGLATLEKRVSLLAGRFDSRQNRAEVVKTDAQGRFEFLPQDDEPFLLIVAGDSGFAEITSENLAKSSHIVLRPWGHLRGRVLVGDQPDAGREISFWSKRP